LDLVRACADQFGKQAVVYSLDVPSLVCRETEKRYALKAAKVAEEAGAGELLLQSKGRDGTMEGYDLDLIREVSQAVSIPVIASGGCSGYEDMYQAIKAGASAVAAGAMFLFTEQTPRGAAQYLASKGVEVRI
jgi:cyclase